MSPQIMKVAASRPRAQGAVGRGTRGKGMARKEEKKQAEGTGLRGKGRAGAGARKQPTTQ